MAWRKKKNDKNRAGCTPRRLLFHLRLVVTDASVLYNGDLLWRTTCPDQAENCWNPTSASRDGKGSILIPPESDANSRHVCSYSRHLVVVIADTSW